MTHTPRYYQQDARYQVNTLLNASRHPVYVAPTGTGKTKTAVTVIQDQVSIGNRIYILTPQVEIFDGWLSDLINSNIDFGTISEGRILGASKPVYLCMPMTLVNLLSYIPEAIYPDIIITDECHHSSANTWEQIYQFFPYAIRFGLTATPKRTDGKGLDHLYTDIIQTITMKEAIYHDPPYLSTPLVIAPEMYLDLLKDVEIVNGEYDLSAQAEALGKTQIIGNVIENYSKVFAGLPVLVACSTFEHAKDMTKQFNDAG
ncbi:DEAD/DEAH box helicase family protein, partial [bacterium]|nr:DEAD/DEAH box helicase family protein [bacterium]